jgi:NodT family efflux transporter outer membrane factor (OMF) lipoprotein
MARRAPALLLALSLAACSLAPDYKVPPVPVAAQYHSGGPWQVAQPADRLPRDGWWRLYGDAQLDQLQQSLLANNADLSAALSHYRQAQAFSAEASAGLFPTVTAGADPQRDRQSATRPLRVGGPNDYNSVTLGGEVNYEVDLWGRVRDSVAAGKDEAQAAQADLASVQLSLQAQLADNYVQLRGFDEENELLRQSIAAFQKALQLTETLHGGGIVSGLDVSRAQTEVSSAQSLLTQTLAQRALIEHAIAVLVGASASQFTIAPKLTQIALPQVPTGVPSSLLQRRPDIAEAERLTAAANAKIGEARAAYFPALMLSAQGGLQSAAYAGLLSAPNFFWVIGPELVGTIFDGGKHKAEVAAARAATDEAGAHYRSVVLSAFQQVEDSLVLLDDLGTALQQQRDAANAAQHAEDLAMNQYRHGAVGYLDVVLAQTTALDAQRSVLDLQTRQLRADVALVRAVGGGWSDSELAATPGKKAVSG